MTKYLFIVIAALGAALYFTGNQMIENKKTADRMEDSYKQSENDNKTLTLNYSELTNSNKKVIDSLAAVVKAKPKTITKYVHVHVTDTIRDTVYVNLEPVAGDPGVFTFLESKDCFKVGGTVSIKDSVPQLTIDKLEYDNDINYIVYLDRRKMQWWFIKYRSLTKKDAKLEIHSDCGTVTVEDVKLIK